MNKNRTEYLALLADEAATERAELVSALHEAATMLDSTSPFLEAGKEAAALAVGVRLAAKLLDVAQRLCDHCRVSGDGRCRYCRTLMNVEEG